MVAGGATTRHDPHGGVDITKRIAVSGTARRGIVEPRTSHRDAGALILNLANGTADAGDPRAHAPLARVAPLDAHPPEENE